MNNLPRKAKLILHNKLLLVHYIVFFITIVFLYTRCYNKNSQITESNDTGFILNSKRSSNKSMLYCYLFVAVLTSPKGFLRRRAIRETWLNLQKTETVARFFIGVKDLNPVLLKDLANEQKNYGDLVFILNLKDSYQNLTQKLLKTLIWIHSNVNTEFVMKVDDDSFVRINVLFSELKKREEIGRIYWGYFRGSANVKRIGPWAEPSWYLSDHYLPYALGGGYVISSDLLPFICAASKYLQHYKSEDVSLGVWLAPAKLNYIHDIRFDTEFKSRGCNNKHIVSHKQEPEHMYEKYDQLLHKNKLCKVESSIMHPFDYDWNGPPSKCCKRNKTLQ